MLDPRVCGHKLESYLSQNLLLLQAVYVTEDYSYCCCHHQHCSHSHRCNHRQGYNTSHFLLILPLTVENEIGKCCRYSCCHYL
jgi:hypothetical protein